MLLSCKNEEVKKHEFNPIIKRYASCEDVNNGSVVRSSKLTEFNNAEFIGKFSSVDFSIQNLIAIGGDKYLNSYYLGSVSTLSMADSFEPKS